MQAGILNGEEGFFIKRILILMMISFFLFTYAVSAAESEENYLLRYGGGGGMLEMLSFDNHELNQLLVKNGFAPLENKIITYGGNFFSQTNNNFRYSCFGSRGAISTDTVDEKAATLSLGHLGVWLEKVFPLAKDFSFNGGLAASFGGMDLHLIHQSPDDNEDGLLKPRQTFLQTSFLMAKPQIGLSYSLKRYLDLEVKVGYYYLQTIGGWHQGRERIPGDQMLTSLSGLSLLINLNFGF